MPHLTRQQEKAMFAKQGNRSGVSNQELEVKDVAVFQSRGRITGGEIDFRKNKTLVGKRLVVSSRTAGGVILKTRSKTNNLKDVAIFKQRGKITGGEIDFRKGREVVGRRLIVSSRTQGGVILKVRK